jgi:hypothetical protein
MWEKIETFFNFTNSRRRDEHAAWVWQGIGPLVPADLPEIGEHKLMAGQVLRTYQRANRGTKAVVHFGAEIGEQDTWWEWMNPPVGRWVIVRASLWLPPGTHSGEHVIWINSWESWAPADTYKRALRHQLRMERLADSGHVAATLDQ